MIIDIERVLSEIKAVFPNSKVVAVTSDCSKAKIDLLVKAEGDYRIHLAVECAYLSSSKTNRWWSVNEIGNSDKTTYKGDGMELQDAINGCCSDLANRVNAFCSAKEL